jgi:hypothetical protein
MNCPYCRKLLEIYSLRCPHCGSSLTGAPQASPESLAARPRKPWWRLVVLVVFIVTIGYTGLLLGFWWLNRQVTRKLENHNWVRVGTHFRGTGNMTTPSFHVGSSLWRITATGNVAEGDVQDTMTFTIDDEPRRQATTVKADGVPVQLYRETAVYTPKKPIHIRVGNGRSTRPSTSSTPPPPTLTPSNDHVLKITAPSTVRWEIVIEEAHPPTANPPPSR